MRARSCRIAAFAALFLSLPSVHADDKFKGDGSAGGLMPDFSQDQGQAVKGICSAASAADCLWYLDQHGFGGLVNHTKNDPNETWKDDSKKLVLDLATLIFGKKYLDGQGAGIDGGVEKGLRTYVKNKGFDKITPQRATALTVKHRDVIDSYYDWWKFYGGNAFYPALGDFSWRDDKGKTITFKDGQNRNLLARHAMAVAGINTDDNKTFVVMGWGDHPADKPPYKKPPYADGEEPYMDTYNIDLVDFGNGRKRMQIPSADGVNLFKRVAADHIALDAIDSIENPKTKVNIPLPPPKMLKQRSLDADQQHYDYSVTNDPDNDFGVKQFFLEVQVPFSLGTVTAPTGWNYTLWDPAQTPEITPAPEALTESGPLCDPDAGNWAPDYSGILFYTLSQGNAVEPGMTLGGFGYSADAAFPFGEDALFAGVSSDAVALVNPSYAGSTTEYTFVGGPLVPEPGAGLLLLSLVMIPIRKPSRRSLAG